MSNPIINTTYNFDNSYGFMFDEVNVFDEKAVAEVCANISKEVAEELPDKSFDAKKEGKALLAFANGIDSENPLSGVKVSVNSTKSNVTKAIRGNLDKALLQKLVSHKQTESFCKANKINPKALGMFAVNGDLSQKGMDSAQQALQNAQEFFTAVNKNEQEKLAVLRKSVFDSNTAKMNAVMQGVSDEQFAMNFDYYSNIADTVSKCDGVTELAKMGNFKLTEQDKLKAQYLSQFGKTFSQYATMRACKLSATDYSAFSEKNADTLREHFAGYQIDEEGQKPYSYTTAKQIDDYRLLLMQMSNLRMAVQLVDQGIDPQKIMFAKGKQSELEMSFDNDNEVMTFDMLATNNPNNDPLCLYDKDGNLVSYVEFDKNGNSTVYNDVQAINVSDYSKESQEAAHSVFGEHNKSISDENLLNDANDNYKNIADTLKGLSEDDYTENTRDTMKGLYDSCRDYIKENSAKENLSDVDNKRLDAVKKLYRTLDASFTKDDIDFEAERKRLEEKQLQEDLNKVDELERQEQQQQQVNNDNLNRDADFVEEGYGINDMEIEDENPDEQNINEQQQVNNDNLNHEENIVGEGNEINGVEIDEKNPDEQNINEQQQQINNDNSNRKENIVEEGYGINNMEIDDENSDKQNINEPQQNEEEEVVNNEQNVVNNEQKVVNDIDEEDKVPDDFVNINLQSDVSHNERDFNKDEKKILNGINSLQGQIVNNDLEHANNLNINNVNRENALFDDEEEEKENVINHDNQGLGNIVFNEKRPSNSVDVEATFKLRDCIKNNKPFEGHFFEENKREVERQPFIERNNQRRNLESDVGKGIGT